jgi:hypothetical protein
MKKPPQRHADSGSPINLPTEAEQLLGRIEEMKKIAGELTEAQKQRRSLAELLDGNFCLGEDHQDISTKEFLEVNMLTFKENGFSVLFMEHLAADSDLSERLKSLDENHMWNKKSEYNFTSVVEAASKHGIEIVNLEESDEIYRRYKEGPERMVSLNYNAREVITKKEQEFLKATGTPLKWFAFVGSGHLNSCHGVPGICEIIPNVQDFLIADSGPIPEGLNVSISIVRDSEQDMRIESILNDQGKDEGGASENRGRSSSEEELPKEGLPYKSKDGEEGNAEMKPFPKIANPGSPSAVALASGPLQNGVSKP